MQFPANICTHFEHVLKKTLFPITRSGRNNALFLPICPKVMKTAQKLAIKQNLEKILPGISTLNIKF